MDLSVLQSLFQNIFYTALLFLRGRILRILSEVAFILYVSNCPADNAGVI